MIHYVVKVFLSHTLLQTQSSDVLTLAEDGILPEEKLSDFLSFSRYVGGAATREHHKLAKVSNVSAESAPPQCFFLQLQLVWAIAGDSTAAGACEEATRWEEPAAAAILGEPSREEPAAEAIFGNGKGLDHPIFQHLHHVQNTSCFSFNPCA